MTPPSTLTTLFQHHLWANLRLFQACEGLTDAQLDASVAGTYGSIRDTLQHIVVAEQSYLSRITTGRRLHRPDDAPPLTMAEMLASLRATGESLIAWGPKVAPEDTVSVDWEPGQRDVPKAVLLTQAVNHATEHRSQVMTILTQLGIEPPECDGWNYFVHQGP